MIYVVTHQTCAGIQVYMSSENESRARSCKGPMHRLWQTAPEGYAGPCLVVCSRARCPEVKYANEYKTASRARKVIEGLPREDKDLGLLYDPWPLLALPSEIKRWQSKAK